MLESIERELERYIAKNDHPPHGIYVTRAGHIALKAEIWEILSKYPGIDATDEFMGVPVLILDDDNFVLGG